MSESPGIELIRIFADVLEDTLKNNKLLADVVSLFDSDAIFLKLEKRFEHTFILSKQN